MASCLIGEAEFDAGFAPLGAVRCDAASARTVACHKMREFVQQGSFDFAPAERAQLWVQHNQVAGRVCEAGGAAHPAVPENGDPFGERCEAECVEAVGGEQGQFGGRCSLPAFCTLNQDLQGAVRVNGLKNVKG